MRKDARKEGATDNPRCCPSSKAANEYYDYYYYYYYYYYISYKTICSSPQEIIPIPCWMHVWLKHRVSVDIWSMYIDVNLSLDLLWEFQYY